MQTHDHVRILLVVNDCITNAANDSIDFLLFNDIVQALHRREPITLQKFKSIHHYV
jgi:hypothetical protein